MMQQSEAAGALRAALEAALAREGVAYLWGEPGVAGRLAAEVQGPPHGMAVHGGLEQEARPSRYLVPAGPGAPVRLLWGAEPPARLRLRDPGWPAAGPPPAFGLPLPETAAVAAWLAAWGKPEGTGPAPEWWALTGGHPQALERLAAAATHWRRVAVPRHPRLGRVDPAMRIGFLVEHLLHPGSRRLAWRPGGRDPLDQALAALLWLPAVDGPGLAGLIGSRTAAEAWRELEALPVVQRYGAGAVGLRAGFRRQVLPYAFRVRPWTLERLRRRALAFCLAQLEEGPAASVARWCLALAAAEAAFGGPAGLRAGRGGPLSVPGGEGLAWLAPGWQPGLEGLLVRRCPRHLWVLREAPGAVAAWAAGGGRGRTFTVRAWVLARPEPALLWHLGLTLARAWLDREGVWSPAGPEEGDPLQAVWGRLGFRPERRGWAIDLSGPRRLAWLRALAPVPAPDREEGAWAELGRQALAWLRDPAADGAELGRMLAGVAPPALVRAWVRDTWTAPDWDADPEGHRMLLAYDLEGLGPHRELARTLHWSRASYYRRRRQALARLGRALLLAGP
ncbi:protein of unknown function [Candidatus Hydrogenisulfobacillus filiaventi]|uniref:Uncharacterized protein n=1 Tax=Candidatus Hydrogenisulfobacillus filiaventi TaxID=2707344 RepID=A0A6F8ZJA1_9FIRM|nr:protein of unknown function [Candidatus Hydrogenisulfobacillus filiaventi]